MENSNLPSGQMGQTVVEYILLLVVLIGMLGLLTGGFKKIQNELWQNIACRVSAACPNCPAPENVKDQKYPGVCR